jgi:hypothetical protein
MNGLRKMLRLIKDEHIPICAHGSDQIWILRLISRLVDFTFVNNPLMNLKATLGSTPITANFLLRLVIPAGVLLGRRVGKLHFGHLKVVSIIARSVGSN